MTSPPSTLARCSTLTKSSHSLITSSSFTQASIFSPWWTWKILQKLASGNQNDWALSSEPMRMLSLSTPWNRGSRVWSQAWVASHHVQHARLLTNHSVNHVRIHSLKFYSLMMESVSKVLNVQQDSSWTATKSAKSVRLDALSVRKLLDSASIVKLVSY